MTSGSSSGGTGLLLRLMRDGQPRTRGELAEITGLGRSTVAQRVDALLCSALLGPVGEATSTGGRPPVRFAFNPSARIVLSADIGATHIRLAVTDLSATLLATELVDIDIADGPVIILGWVLQHGRALITQAGRTEGDLAGIGLGLPGPVEFATGRPVNPPIMPGWDGFNVPGFFADTFPEAVVVVDNDVNVMALGERYMVFSHVDHLMLVKVSTGIGSGIISDGELRRGARGAAGDLGHIQVPNGDEVMCRCGNLGCLEALASGSAVARRLTAAGEPASSSHDVVRLARGRSVLAAQMLRDAGRMIGEVLASAVSLLNPSVIIIGGTLAEAGESLLAGVREVVYRRSLPLATSDLRIVTAQTGDKAGVVGAAVLVIDHLLAPSKVDEYVNQFS